jgi:uncharacterized protein YbdZ (MbtH family)
MSITPLVLTQVTSKVWIGEPLTDDEIQFMDSVGLNELPTPNLCLELSYNLELYRRTCNQSTQVYVAVTSEGYYFVFIDGSDKPAYWTLSQEQAYQSACGLIVGRG